MPKKFLDANGVAYLASLLDNYPNNEILGSVIDAIQEALEEKAGTSLVTSSEAGLMSSTDKTKLDTIDLNALLPATVSYDSETETLEFDLLKGLNLESQIKKLKTTGGRPTIYCYGDSLTEGVGAYVMQPDQRHAYMNYSYPAWVGQTYDVVNLGARAEDVPTIMARQGADPMIITADNLTIPADLTPIKIGEATNLYTSSQTGIPTRSGATAVPLLTVEAAGINPCTIAGVEGILYRTIEYNSPSSGGSFDYYFKRLKTGTAVNIPQNTEIQTFAMRNYRNGIAVIWMGINGGASSAFDFINKVNDMVMYGKYINYIIIIGREFSGSNLEKIKTAFTDDDGFCHVISLMDQLPYRGYALAGLPNQNIDTSEWSTTDAIKKNAPLLCDYIEGYSGENAYGTLHFSAWGYKAIGKLVVEKLAEMGVVSGGNGGSTITPWVDENDEYGHLIYKLPTAKILDGVNYLNTKIKLYDDVNKNWTFAIKWSGTPTSPGGYPANIFCCALDGQWKGILYRYYAQGSANLLFGSAVFNIDGTHNMTDNWGDTNICIITKSGGTYSVRLNNESRVYDGPLTYNLDPQYAINLPLIIGVRYNSNGTGTNFPTAFTVEECRIYDEALTDEKALALYQEFAE